MGVITSEQPTFLSVAELFQNGQYVIPIYQRNYAWGPTEVEQLLQDILDMSLRHDASSSNYYLGSLVVHRRKDDRFETIDGQQRHTTLSIILAALKQNDLLPEGQTLNLNLEFESRPRSASSLALLFDTDANYQQAEEATIKTAFSRVEGFLDKKVIDKPGFVKYLLNQTKLLRTVVPGDTDLNHYFEIMNNRGEQLEKHEVLKARLMGIKDATGDGLTDLEQRYFAVAWDACAEMDRYLVMSFNTVERKALFGDDLDQLPADFKQLQVRLNEAAEALKKQNKYSDPANDNELTLAQILNKPSYQTQQNSSNEEYDGAFNGVINFPNFLLHVLRIYIGSDVSLDDKELLPAFSEHIAKPEQVKEFIHTLMVCRQLLDCYIIKRKNDEKWTLRSLKPYDSGTTSDVNSFNEEPLNRQLAVLLSMFHVSYPSQSRKYWLNAALAYLYKHSKTGNAPCGKAYLKHLELLSDHFFFRRFYTDSPATYDDMLRELSDLRPTRAVCTKLNRLCLHQGTHTQNFIFNRLDYLLWKKLTLKGETAKYKNGDYIKDRAARFSFTARSSVEHYYPQHPMDDIPFDKPLELPKGVDTFGNLCLISHSQNSRLSNFMPKAKKDFYAKTKAPESLKQVIMMSYEDWGPLSSDMIKKHEDEMIQILCGD